MSLYVSASGREVNAHSYSGGAEFKFCRRKYKLHRLLGWQEKAKKAAPEFGKAIESAIQYFHENGMKKGDCSDEFKRIWLKFQTVEMEYTDADGDWVSLYTVGSELSALYELTVPNLPIKNPKFQLEYRKELWPGTGLEFLAYVDLLSTLEDGSRIVVDIKTAKLDLNLPPNMLSLDPQLQRYAWVTGIPDVAFLWLVKAKPNSFKKGDTVTLLEDSGVWKAGQVLSVAKYAEREDDGVVTKLVTVGEPAVVHLLDEEMSKISGKGSTEKKDQVLAQYLADGKLTVVGRESLTKTRIQFVTARVSESDLPEIGDAVGQEVVSIMDAREKDKFFRDGGVRFPNNQCTWCSYRGLCLNQPALVEQLLVKIGPSAPEKDWLSDLEEETE